jgi:DNA polymerase (family 10)
MPLHNADIASVFDEIADLLDIQGANPFRVRAYRKAARVLRDSSRDVVAMVRQGEDLTELPGIGEDLAGKILEVVSTGTCTQLGQLGEQMPQGLSELLRLPGLGPRRVKALHDRLGISNLEDLGRAVHAGLVRSVPGLGEKTEQHLAEALANQAQRPQRFLRALAVQYAEPLVEYLRATPGVGEVVVAGSYRRCQETVGDLDVLVAARRGGAVVERFVAYDEVAEVTARGPTRAAVRLRSGLAVDLRVVPRASQGSALHYFTGSKAHNIAVRRLGQQAGLKINEYGVFRGQRRVGGATEDEVFASVGLPWIPPELREDTGELEAARTGRLPRLVELADLRGDLHSHTKATDGRNDLREMALAARARGLEYLAITDHSPSVRIAHGIGAAALLAQAEEIDRLNEELEGITLLKGAEVDILEDGTLDLPDAVLRRLDVVVGAVHSRFNLPREKQTTRILQAMDHPCFGILAHPTGRLIGRREPYEVDVPRLIRHARQRGCFLELNAHPERLDLSDLHCRLAKEAGVLVSIASDAHSTDDFAHLPCGVGQARRGWLEKGDVLNTRPVEELLGLLARARGEGGRAQSAPRRRIQRPAVHS